MNKPLQARVHSKVRELQLPFDKNYTTEFLNQEDKSRDLSSLGKHWQDQTVSDHFKRRPLQSIGYQFPCSKLITFGLAAGGAFL